MTNPLNSVIKKISDTCSFQSNSNKNLNWIFQNKTRLKLTQAITGSHTSTFIIINLLSENMIYSFFVLLQGKTRLYYSIMTEIYEKLTPVVGTRPNLKDETIEDVEMEDIQDPAKEALAKKETSEVQSTSSVAVQESQPAKSAESVNTDSPVKFKQQETTQAASVKVEGQAEAGSVNTVDATSKVEVPVDTSKENKQVDTVKLEEKAVAPAKVEAAKVTIQEAIKEEAKAETESNPKTEEVAVTKKVVETAEKPSPGRTTRSTEDKKPTPAKK